MGGSVVVMMLCCRVAAFRRLYPSLRLARGYLPLLWDEAG